jgi:predicted secreted protein
MVRAVTEKFEELILEVETSTPGTYAKLCGMVDITISRKANTATSEIPDCDDESLPHVIERSVTSLEVTASGTGVWAQSSWGTMSDWFYAGTTKNVRIVNSKAAVGDTEIEAGAAILTQLDNARSKGARVSADISLEFSGTITRTDQT